MSANNVALNRRSRRPDEKDEREDHETNKQSRSSEGGVWRGLCRKPSKVFAFEAEDLIVVRGQVRVTASMLALTFVDRRDATHTSRRPEDKKTRSEILESERDGNLLVPLAVHTAANYQAREVVLPWPRNRYTTSLVGIRPVERLSSKVYVLVYEKAGDSIGLHITKMSMFVAKVTPMVSDVQPEPPLRNGMER